MNTLDSILNGIKFNQQETAKKQDSYLDDGHIFDFSNALQFANQSNNFSFDAVQNNSNDIISQHSVSATPYSATATAHDNSYQKSLDEAVSKYNLNKSSDDGYSHKENNAVSNSNDNNYEGRTSADKADDKEVQASAKEEGFAKEVKHEDAKASDETSNKEVKAENEAKGEAETSKAEAKAQKVQGEAQKVQVDTLLEEMDTEVSAEDTKKAKELLKAQELETEVETDVKAEKTAVKTEEKEVKLEAKIEANVKAQVEVKAVKENAPVASKLKEDLEVKVEADAKVDLEQAPEAELSMETDLQGEEGMMFGQKQDAQVQLRGKSSGLPAEMALSNASKRAAFNKVFSAAQPKSLEESNILNQVIRKVSEKIAQNNPKISVSLTPDKLGKIDVDFITGKNGLTAQITAESSQVKEALSKNLNSLKESLASQGVSVSNINIKVEKSEESNNANLDFNQNKGFDLEQQGGQAGNSNFAQEGNEGNNVAYSEGADMQEELEENLEVQASMQEENKPSKKSENSTVEYEA